MKPKILYLSSANYSALSLNRLANNFDIVECSDELVEIKSKIARVEILISSLNVNLSHDFLTYFKNLKIILTNTTGINHIETRNLVVPRIISLNDAKELVNISATAELAWALLLNTVRSIPYYLESVKKDEWNRYLTTSTMLRSRRLGIVGLGRIGRMMARYAAAFDLPVTYFDPFVKDDSIPRVETIEELVATNDIISIHVPLNEKNKGMFSDSLFKHFTYGSILINTSRGELINETDLIKYINNGRIKSIGIDVLAEENSIDFPSCNELIKLAKINPKVLITPHIGGVCEDARQATESIIIRKLEEVYGFN